MSRAVLDCQCSPHKCFPEAAALPAALGKHRAAQAAGRLTCLGTAYQARVLSHEGLGHRGMQRGGAMHCSGNALQCCRQDHWQRIPLHSILRAEGQRSGPDKYFISLSQEGVAQMACQG